jgi:hypothetical protein
LQASNATCTGYVLASQDIAVDGWALTMLSRRNVGKAAGCNPKP